jgi:ankyrin repeat protein
MSFAADIADIMRCIFSFAFIYYLSPAHGYSMEFSIPASIYSLSLWPITTITIGFVKNLLHKGASFNAADWDFQTPPHYTAINGQRDVVEG